MKNHHFRRLEEVVTILENRSPQHAFEVASRMSWDLTAKTWEDFPLAQKWFATGEAISHLRRLELDNRIRRAASDPVILYEPA